MKLSKTGTLNNQIIVVTPTTGSDWALHFNHVFAGNYETKAKALAGGRRMARAVGTK